MSHLRWCPGAPLLRQDMQFYDLTAPGEEDLEEADYITKNCMIPKMWSNR